MLLSVVVVIPILVVLANDIEYSVLSGPLCVFFVEISVQRFCLIKLDCHFIVNLHGWQRRMPFKMGG